MRTECRVCNNPLQAFYDFGMMPLSNNLERYNSQSAIECEKFPLTLMRCSECTLIQLSEVVDPIKLYSYYTYRSGMSMTFRKHCHEMAKDINARRLKNESRGLICDIAGNDGTLALEISKECNMMPLVVDPAHNILHIAQDNGCAIHKAFWGAKAAEELLNAEKNRFGGADIITATNVFAHVDDVYDFAAGVKKFLKPDGIFICEFPHGLRFIKECQFDTAYFEHLSYMTLSAFSTVMANNDLEVFEVQKVNIHGGSLRVWVAHKGMKDIDKSVTDIYTEEIDLYYAFPYVEFVRKVGEAISKVCDQLNQYARSGKKIVGFGASAKGNTLLNMLPREILPGYIIDETPEKIGCYSPGTGLKIYSLESQVLESFKGIDVIMILAWNFKEEITRKLRSFGFEGEIYCPL